ncbi:MAG TPA: hypothetical protein VG101_01210 [Puia sp.]|jgi:hypothetical protein|nr:hypothetical protein [Puia sp.]
MLTRALLLFLFTLPGWQALTQTREKSNTCPNRIDSLITDADVLTFIRSLKPREFEGIVFKLPDSQYPVVRDYRRQLQQRLDSFGARSYEKIDLDGNGSTDLLFNGFNSNYLLSLAIFSFAKDSFLVRELTMRNHPEYFSAKSIRVGIHSYIRVFSAFSARKTIPSHKQDGFVEDSLWTRHIDDTLTWLSTSLIEKKPPFPYPIDTLRYQILSGGMLGAFEITLVKDSLWLNKTCDLDPRVPVDSGGMFIGKMDANTAHRLYDVIYAIDWEGLEPRYEIPGFDMSSGNFQLKYNHGKIKTVLDFGLCGTYGLNTLQEMMLDLLKTQEWIRTAPGGRDYFFIGDTY